MRIAYLGPASGTSLHRAQALERCGHDVFVIDPLSMLPKSTLLTSWLHRTGGVELAFALAMHLYNRVMAIKPDVLWVNQGEQILPWLLRRVRTIGIPSVNYMNDDPFSRSGHWQRFRLYRKSISYYDLVVVSRESNVLEAKAGGARRVLRAWFAADEIVHKARTLREEERSRLASEVTFIGTWLPERGRFLAELIKRGTPLTIRGDRWEKAPEWPVLRSHWRGPGLDSADYTAAIQAAKICIGMLSKQNRDLHTTRSMEIPAIGTVLCAQRTSEHLALYKEGPEAVFWGDAAECAEVCKALLADSSRREAIAQRGHERALRNGNFNERLVSLILSTLFDRARPAELGPDTLLGSDPRVSVHTTSFLAEFLRLASPSRMATPQAVRPFPRI